MLWPVLVHFLTQYDWALESADWLIFFVRTHQRRLIHISHSMDDVYELFRLITNRVGSLLKESETGVNFKHVPEHVPK